MKLALKVLPRKEVLDTQGRTVQQSLVASGFPVSDCKVGKYILMEVDAETVDEAKKKVREMADYVLYNPLIETYEIEQL